MTPASAVTVAHWRAGVWSATGAREAARGALVARWAPNQATIRVGTLLASATASRQTARPTLPAIIHGRRRPHRPVVRSDRRPKIGLPISAAIAPMPRMMPWVVGARSAPTTDVTLIAMLTVIGPSTATNSASWANANEAISLGLAGGISGVSTTAEGAGRVNVAVMTFSLLKVQ